MTETTEQAAARIAEEIASQYRHGNDGLVEVAESILTRELPALAGRVVEVTAEDVRQALGPLHVGYDLYDNGLQRDRFVESINASLRARAGAAPVATFDVEKVALEINLTVSRWWNAGPGLAEYVFRGDAIAAILRKYAAPVATTPATAWVYPAEVSDLVVPSFGYYFTRTTTDGWSVNALAYHTGEMLTDAVTAIRGWDRTTGEPGPIIERTTCREWTAETVPQSGPYVVLKPYDSREMYWHAWDDKTECARVWNDCGATRWCPVILPATGSTMRELTGLVAELRSRFSEAQTRRYEDDYRLGYYDALGELLEWHDDAPLAAETGRGEVPTQALRECLGFIEDAASATSSVLAHWHTVGLWLDKVDARTATAAGEG